MNPAFQRVVSYLTGKENIEAVDIEELTKEEAESPYFPVTQLLLAIKLAGKNEGEYEKRVEKAAVYFSNPYWLQHLLAKDECETDRVEETNSLLKANGGSNADATEPSATHPVSTNPTDTSADKFTPDTSKEVLDDTNGEAINTAGGAFFPDEVETVTDAANKQAEEEMAAVARNTNQPSEEFIEQLPPTNLSELAASNPAAVPSPLAEIEVYRNEEEMAGVSHESDEITGQFLEEIEHPAHKRFDQQEDEHEKMFQNIKAMLDATSEDADADIKNAVVPIDPYYTIDYFASQGIKLELEKQPQDQLGQNLKKFTQWLRHMKKLGPEDATEVISRSETDADIQQFADTSNTVREVVTEAMALVLEKQGKKEKAIELYNKLSFLNPHKSAFFAQKINNLKGS